MRNLLVRASYFLLSVIVLSISTGVVLGQGGVGSTRGLPSSSGGINTIQGRVYFPPKTDEKRVRVRLDSSNFTSQTTQTDADGAFRFTQLEAGPYTITVEGGKEFETSIENVEIDREASNGGRIISVPIYMKPKPPASVATASVDSYHKALQSIRSGSNKKAIEQLNEALKIQPDFTLALNELGRLYLKTGDTAKAAEIFTSLVRLTPDDPFAHLNLGIALFNQKKPKEAEPHLREAIKLNDKLAAAHYYLGLVLVNSKSYGEAEKELESAIKNGGDNLPLAHRYLGGLYVSSRKNQQAADELEKYLKLDPKAQDAERIRTTIKELRSKP